MNHDDKKSYICNPWCSDDPRRRVLLYNGEKSIKRCSDSILNQHYPELELILVDDGNRILHHLQAETAKES